MDNCGFRRSWVVRAESNGGFIVGAPELLIEIARSSRHYDLNEKKDDYERAGVLEYIVIELDPDQVHWFVRRGDHFEDLPPGPDGIFRSEVFPGPLARPRGALTPRTSTDSSRSSSRAWRHPSTRHSRRDWPVPAREEAPMSTAERTRPKRTLPPLVAGSTSTSPRSTSAMRRCRRRRGPSSSEELSTCRRP